jgi:hypothetical protein
VPQLIQAGRRKPNTTAWFGTIKCTTSTTNFLILVLPFSPTFIPYSPTVDQMVRTIKQFFSGSSSKSNNETLSKAILSAVTVAKAPLQKEALDAAPSTSIDRVEPSTKQSPTLFALLIGIDKYRNSKYELEGAVKDAQEMESYLKTTFPSSQIRTLLDKQATRNDMVREIIDLIQNKKIQPQDPILIFYAGHGGESKPPVGWETQGQKIQMFMPQDYNDDGTVITDVGFAALLEELASVKGDNIVSISAI